MDVNEQMIEESGRNEWSSQAFGRTDGLKTVFSYGGASGAIPDDMELIGAKVGTMAKATQLASCILRR